MHILFVIDTWGLIGGTERHAAVSVPALQARGHRVTILCREDQEPGICEVETVVQPAMVFGPSLERAERAALKEQLAELQPDVIFHSACHNQEAAALLLDFAPVVRYVHDHVLFCPGLNKLLDHGQVCTKPMGLTNCMKRYWFQEGCAHFQKACHENHIVEPMLAYLAKRKEVKQAKRSRVVLTNSDHMRRELLAVGFGEEQTRTLYIFTQSNTAAQPRGPLGEETEAFLAKSQAPLIFVPARLVMEKGVSEFLKAMQLCQNDCRAVIAGTGNALEQFKHDAWVAGIHERVHFAGWSSSLQIEELYERAEVVVHPSVWDEPFGLVGIEAMAHAKPLLAFRVGGVPEWLEDGENGFLSARGDFQAMGAQLDRLLGDAELRQRLGQNGKRLLGERFGMQAHIDGLEAALQTALGAPA